MMTKVCISLFLMVALILSFPGASMSQDGAGSTLAAAPAASTASDAKKYDKVIVLETNQGTIEIKMWPKVAPKACENFVRLAEKGYYNGITFHRVIKGFMIQGGDPQGTGAGGQSIWGKAFKNEVRPDVKFDKVGQIAMANAGPDTNGSQFFITTSVERTKHLNGGYTIFGEVIKGYDVVQKIENAKTGASDKPLQPQKIIKAYVKAGASK